MTALVCAPAAVGTADAFTLALVKNGVTRHTIVLTSGASPSEKHAAQELQKFILEISGATLPIVDEGTAPKSRLVVIGRGTLQNKLAPNIAFDKLGDEGFAVRRVGNSIVIAGGRLRGTMYGVYYLLDEVLGCRWYTSFVSKIPRSKTICIDRLDVVSLPDFEYRQPFYSDASDADWAARNRTNGGFLARLDVTRGGSIAYNRFCHTFDELVPVGTYYEGHPEYYSLTGGARVGGQYRGQLCLTNPDVLKIVTETVLKWIAANPELKIVSVSQNDNSNYCQCLNCAAVDAEEGSPSGLMLRFVNAVAEKVAKQYPGILIDTFAYQYTERPPKVTKPRANVRVRLCPISCCEHHPYEICPRNADFMANLKGWAAITDNTYIWHYTTNFANYLLPMPDFDQFPLSLRLYKRSGVKGVFCEGTDTAGNSPAGAAGWMDNLKAYIQAKMLWSTEIDPAVVRKDFMQGFFGKAWQPIDQYIDLIQAKVGSENIHGGIFQSVEGITFLPPDIIVKCNALFDEAEKLADSPDVLARVKHARLSVRYVEVNRQAEATRASGTPEQKQAVKNTLQVFADDCVKDGITNVSESNTLQAWLNSKLAWLKEFHTALVVNSPDITVAGPTSVIRVDGVLNDSAWGKIAPMTFVATNGEAAKYRTLAYTARDKDYLYFAFINYEPEISKLLTARHYTPAIGDDDSVEIFLSPNPDDRAKCYQFIVNAKGAAWAGVHNSDGSLDDKGSSGFEAKTKIEADRWIVEMKVPFKAIGITPPVAGKKIAANFYRNRHCGQPVIYSCWSSSYDTAHFTPARFGQITFESE